MFLRAGYTVRPELADGFITVDFAIAPSATSREVMQRRELRAEASSIRALLTPRTVAVVGSPPAPSLVDASRAASPEQLSPPADLVIAEYDGTDFRRLMRAAAGAGATGVIVMSRGANPGLEPAAARAIVAAAREAGVRALGPASLGVINTATGLNTTPAANPRPGHTGLVTQSAGVAALTLSHAIARGCGLSSFVATGTFADVTGNDVMQYWSTDDATRVCLLSLDSVGNPRKFFRVLRRLALDKHVVVFLPSRALPAAGPAPLNSVIRDSGAMVVTRRDAMFDIAQLLARQPLPRGRRVHLVSNSAGLSVQMKAAALRFGLTPSATTVSGPPEHGLARETAAALADANVDAVLCAVVDPGGSFAEAVFGQLTELAAGAAVQHRTPLIASFVGFGLPDYRRGSGEEAQGQLPVVDTYADALEALGAVLGNERRRHRARPHPADTVGAGDEDAARAVVDAILAESPGGRWASDEECTRILAAYDIAPVPWKRAADLSGAIDAGAALGWDVGGDVVLKCLSPRVRGRSELPTVIRNIASPEAMRRAWATLATLTSELGLGDDPAALTPVVQRTVSSGASLTLGAVEDPVLGPLISAGVSGISSDLLGDVSWRVPPLRRCDASDMVASLRAAPLLTGYRGTAPADVAGVERVLLQLARLKDDIAAVAEVELTPVIAAASSTAIAGARLRVAPLPDERDDLARRLTP